MLSSSVRLFPLLALLALGLLGADCEPPPDDDVDGGVIEEEDCIIGDPNAEAEIVLVLRSLDGEVVDVVDGGEVPLILPPQGGKVTLIGVRAKNITCRALLNAGLDDELCDGNIIGRDGRPIELEEGPDGFGMPVAPTTLQNYANIPVCPTFGSTRDGDNQPYRLELRITEERRKGEETARTHVLSATVTPVCAEPDLNDDCDEDPFADGCRAGCTCECDADFVLGVERAEQCVDINENDIVAGTCPVEEK